MHSSSTPPSRRKSRGGALAYPASITAQQSDQPALHLDPIRWEDTGLIGRIGGFQSDHVTLAAQALQRRFLVIHQRNHDLAGSRRILTPDNHGVAVENPGVDHR